MAVDTFMAFVGVYDDVSGADADYEFVKELHTKEGLIDAYDAAVIEHRTDGKVKITKKHETPTRVGGVLGGGVGLATGLVLALFPFAAIGTGLLVVTTGGGAVLGAVAGHAAAGMSQGPPGARGAPRRRTGGPGRGRGGRHGGEGRTGHEEGAEGGSQGAEGRHRRNGSRREVRRGVTPPG